MATGNIGSDDLIDLFHKNIATIADLLTQSDFVELTSDSLIVHA